MAASNLYIGTAGWSLPRAEQHRFPAGASHLARYAAVFRAVEINSTFHRPHRESTFARWAQTVPRGFRFSIKMPRTITHDANLSGASRLVDGFLASLAPLGSRVDCLLVQLPPSLALDRRVARNFFSRLRERFERGIAVEPRHGSWFTAEADRMLDELQVARVAADPPRAEHGGDPGGWRGLAYFRLHGFPRVYYSSYEEAFLDALAEQAREDLVHLRQHDARRRHRQRVVYTGARCVVVPATAGTQSFWPWLKSPSTTTPPAARRETCSRSSARKATIPK